MRQRDVQRRMFYTPKDGLMLGLLGVLTPVIAMLILGVVMVFIALAGGAGFENLFDSTVFKYITQVIAECAFVLVLYVYNKIAKVDFVSASQFKTAPKYLNWAVAIIIGIAMPIFFSPLISMWERLLDLIGIQLPTLADRGIPLSTGWDLTVAILILGVLPAFCEELMFRGGILNGLRDRGVWFAVLYSAMCFSLMHESLQQLPYTFILGLVIGYIVYYTRCIWLGILIHFCNNATVLVSGFISNDVSESGFTALTGADIVYAILMTAVAVTLVVGAMIFTKKYNQPHGKIDSKDVTSLSKTTFENSQDGVISKPMRATPPPTSTPVTKDSLSTAMVIATPIIGVVMILLNIFV